AYAAADTTRPGWLFLGDSVTMGSGVAPDSTFAGRVAAGQDALDVWNPSLIGYSSADYLRVLDTLISRKRLRRVSVLWCLNDVYAGLPIPAGPQGSRVLQSRWMGFVREHVFTYQWLKATLLDRQRAYYLHDRAYYLETDRHLRTAMEHLRRMADLTWARGLLFEVVLIPYEYQLRTGDAGPQRLLARLLRAQGVAVRDAWPDFARAGASRRLYLYGDGIHLSALGHRVMADVLLRQPTSQEAG
ncbi:MAG TPA: GDSL-type esterase/lipase family protein, partial [Rhodothermales bacterium]|nr:GDSL-type esterase/lipase family protein [Rhodothermales bacterium]